MHSDDHGQIRKLLAHLSVVSGEAHQWGEWQIAPITGGMNNRLYRATTAGADLAVKWTLPDERDRAGREFGALQSLRSLGLDLAPAPVLLDRSGYRLPVVVQTWLGGETLAAPPESDADWVTLLEHYAAIHQVTPKRLGTPLPTAVLTAGSVDSARELVWRQVRRLPADARPGMLQRLAARLDAWEAPRWPEPPSALVRCDPNVRNFVRRPAGWASVDWENSGWGDPAFEIADMTAHASYLEVDAARWEWVAHTYARLSPDTEAHRRIAAYRMCLLVWWVARLARMLYEVPRGRDERLAARPPDWSADVTAKLERYVARAGAALRDMGA